MQDLKSCVLGRVGSSPAVGTKTRNFNEEKRMNIDTFLQWAIILIYDELYQNIALGIVAATLLIALRYFLQGRRKWGTEAMGKPIDYTRPNVSFSKKEKQIILEMAEDYLEEKVLMRKMGKSVKQQIYKKLGQVCGIDELIPPGNTKARLKSLRKYLNGNNKPVKIPGEKPIQDIKPNKLVMNTKEEIKNKFTAFFSKSAAA